MIKIKYYCRTLSLSHTHSLYFILLLSFYFIFSYFYLLIFKALFVSVFGLIPFYFLSKFFIPMCGTKSGPFIFGFISTIHTKKDSNLSLFHFPYIDCRSFLSFPLSFSFFFLFIFFFSFFLSYPCHSCLQPHALTIYMPTVGSFVFPFSDDPHFH